MARRLVRRGVHLLRQLHTQPFKQAHTQPSGRRSPNMDLEPTQDYTHWTNSDLIQRVTTLEAQLRAQTHAHTPTPQPRSPKKPKKTSNAFDSSKYHTRLIALKFAYLGRRYNGFEHAANNKTPLPTVEEMLWKALMKTRLIFPDIKEGKEEEVCWDGCEYSKCGRTDKGVSAFGQVIGVRVRSNRPKAKEVATVNDEDGALESADGGNSHMRDTSEDLAWDSVHDELPYNQMLNRVLPPDIRVLAWCPNPPPDFSARFNCRERRYRYFFTNPAYPPTPGESRDGGLGGAWLDIAAMHKAAKKLEGLHDFRNLCKVDPSKQLSDFRRRIFHASVERVGTDQGAGAFLQRGPFADGSANTNGVGGCHILPELFYIDVRGSAFLWHQVRHMAAVLLLVGQGFEQPSIVDDLVDIQKTSARPVYEMAVDTPLVLWDCIFPDLTNASLDHHAAESSRGYDDALDWYYVGDHADSAAPTRASTGVEDRKYGRMSIMEDLWALWQRRKLDEFLAGSLMDIVARSGRSGAQIRPTEGQTRNDGARVVDGSGEPRPVGHYVPLMKRERLDTPDVVNARYAVRKGLTIRGTQKGPNGASVDVDE